MMEPVDVDIILGRGWFPTKAHPSDAAFDLKCADGFQLWNDETRVVDTGIRIMMPPSVSYALVLPRSGLAARHSITVVNSPGLIDKGYQGEIKVILHRLKNLNMWDSAVSFIAGDRIAQILFVGPPVEFNEVLEFDYETDRGSHGIGSTGV